MPSLNLNVALIILIGKGTTRLPRREDSMVTKLRNAMVVLCSVFVAPWCGVLRIEGTSNFFGIQSASEVSLHLRLSLNQANTLYVIRHCCVAILSLQSPLPRGFVHFLQFHASRAKDVLRSRPTGFSAPMKMFITVGLNTLKTNTGFVDLNASLRSW
jgi:hypothetical protein